MARQAAIWGALVLGSAALGISFPASAHADDDTDFIYLVALKSEDIFLIESTAVAAGHAVCSDFAGGAANYEVVFNAMDITGLSFDEAGFLAGAAVAAYCPEFEGSMY